MVCICHTFNCCRKCRFLFAVNSVLAIGGVGGLAVGLAGREILENLFTGLIILSSSPFEVGDEVLFSPPNGQVSSNPQLAPTICSRETLVLLRATLRATARWIRK